MTSTAEIARRMLDMAPHHALVRVGTRVAVCDVARDITASLVGESVSACWMHAAEDLSPVFRFATRETDTPLEVTTGTSDWSSFEHDRLWTERPASLVFVISTHALGDLPPQVRGVFPDAYLVRRNASLHHRDDEAHEIMGRARHLLGLYAPTIDTLRLLATEARIERTRIRWEATHESVALDLVEEAVRCDCLDTLVAQLHVRYPQTEIALLMDAIRRRYQRLDG